MEVKNHAKRNIEFAEASSAGGVNTNIIKKQYGIPDATIQGNLLPYLFQKRLGLSEKNPKRGSFTMFHKPYIT
jgi:hypothetical protein